MNKTPFIVFNLLNIKNRKVLFFRLLIAAFYVAKNIIQNIFFSVACGLTHTLFLSEEGQVYSCGNHERGQLGHNKPNRRPGIFHHIRNLSNLTVVLSTIK